MSTDNNRLLIELEKRIRDLNREIINPTIPALGVDDLTPVMQLVARARATYLAELFAITAAVDEGLPNGDQLNTLRRLRLTYEELLQGAQALETAIQRGYLDVAAAGSGRPVGESA